ncbi:aminotransferase class I/II-fold pyridoxal phosphate-dependent enzyme [Flavivirga jejuensis]|uniref:Aminotransferase class I/II-fold pyridoxal phosphate-dependent enzyme n=1 Tax=Flavivirga jejuensis TaxID=870487 RepID=A0ABT8WHY3_9FLAO|nr:aminotransferase class I/II-fold pyridoxal phosphate-dependent enzyme [Flavivirga jejuensis]MDO5972740.1 aminotransferase class I/II-fold pyridoxal phosphate-dependent enzyme [Flavivirga jejuensis]
MFPKKLHKKLEERKANNALRQLGTQCNLVDFSSNDYLGFSKSKTIFNSTHEFLIGHNITHNGATGSRLLSGNHSLFNIIETLLSNFHNSESALIFNSGYDANVGFFSSIPQRGDIILYDEYIHASIRDGIKLSNAKAYKFKHNNLEDLGSHLERGLEHSPETNIYIVTESVFSMDGDSPDLKGIVQLCKKHHTFLIIDEAHAVGVFGERGAGLVQHLKLEKNIFARIITFGKAIGTHGAVIIGSESLKQYLVNFSRSFIYTTALPPHTLSNIHSAYHELIITKNREQLHKNMAHFKNEIIKNGLQNYFIESHSAIHSCIISGNDTVKRIAQKFQELGFNIKPILSPTVPKEQERLRFCLHAFNSEGDISDVLKLLATFVHI